MVKTLVLSTLFLTMGLVWLLVYAGLLSRFADFFRSTRVRRGLEGLSGAILVVLGVRIAVQDA